MAGRPPSEKTFANMLRLAIHEAHGEGGNKLRAVAEALVNKAIGGDVAAIKEVADRLDGKATQAIEGTVTADDALTRLLAEIAENGRRIFDKTGDEGADHAR